MFFAVMGADHEGTGWHRDFPDIDTRPEAVDDWAFHLLMAQHQALDFFDALHNARVQQRSLDSSHEAAEPFRVERISNQG